MSETPVSETPLRFVYINHHARWNQSRLTDVLRRRGHHVEYRCHRGGDPLPAVDEFDGVIIGGGDVSVWQAAAEPFMEREIDYARQVVDAGVRYFGICLGSQILGAAYGSTSAPRPDGRAEFGFYEIEPTDEGAEFFAGLDHVYQAHYEQTTPLPANAVLLGRSAAFEVQAFRIGLHAYGVQFHPDARADMIEAWWHDNAAIRTRPGIQPLARQLVDAATYEDARRQWVERTVTRWLAGAAAGVGAR
jgi:GMP synthase (glutamine-hydrolysing)